MGSCYILSFVKTHRGSLDSAAKAFPGIREAVAALYAVSDAVVVFDEELFSDLTAFKSRVRDVINRGNTNPGYLLECLGGRRSPGSGKLRRNLRSNYGEQLW